MSKQSDESNSILEQLIATTANPKIIYASHNLQFQGLTQDQVFGTPSQKKDGIHMNGAKGKIVITSSLKNLFQQSKIKTTPN